MCFGHVEGVTGHPTPHVLHLKSRRVISRHKNVARRASCRRSGFRRSNNKRFAAGLVSSGASSYQSLLNCLGNRLADLGRFRLATDVSRAGTVDQHTFDRFQNRSRRI